MSVRGILFDLDGTLVDTAPDYVAALNQLLEEENRRAVDYHTARVCVSRGATALLRVGFGDDHPADELQHLRPRLLNIYAGCVTDQACLFDGVASVLDAIERQGITWGIVTNKPTFLTHPLVEHLSLTTRAAAIVCGDTLQRAKPHPEPLLHACQLAEIDPGQTIMVGDAKADIDAGRAAGLQTIIAAYGYISSDTDTSTWNANASIDRAIDLLSHF